MKELKSLVLYRDTCESMKKLSIEMTGKYIQAMFAEMSGEDPPEFTTLESFGYEMIKGQVLRAADLSKKMSEQGAKGAQRRKEAQAQEQGRIPSESSGTWQNAVEAYNKLSERFPEFPKMESKLSEKKIKSVEAIIEEHGFDAIAEMLKKAAESSFLRGKVPPQNPGEKQFSSCFNWLFSQKHFNDVLGGKYDDWDESKKGGAPKSSNKDMYTASMEGCDTDLSDIL
ncbi:MAG: hypothetical protein LBT59_13575 [Clostridiales bacterium]|nr:hypothetical protein [Clostridiales bacterium]